MVILAAQMQPIHAHLFTVFMIAQCPYRIRQPQYMDWSCGHLSLVALVPPILPLPSCHGMLQWLILANLDQPRIASCTTQYQNAMS